MSIIRNIKIQNIKGFGNNPVTLPVELKTNRINLLFAPNGTGKSSLAAAFKSLSQRTLDVNKEDKYHKDETLPSSLSLELDGTAYTADAHHNNISSHLRCKVINCATNVQTIQQNRGNYTNVRGFLDINDIVIEQVVPYTSNGYSVMEIRRSFGTNGKILDNLSNDFGNTKFLIGTKVIWDKLDFFAKAQGRMALVQDILDNVNSIEGTKPVVLRNINHSWFDQIELNQTYNEITNTLQTYIQCQTRCLKFLTFYQMLIHWQHNKLKIKAATAYAEYCQNKKEIDDNLQLLDNTWKNIHTEEVHNQLVVRFPQADEISNGQRDLLTFLVSLIKFKMLIKSGKKYLLLIDEVFDYLDDANMIVAQYFLTSFLDISKDNLFLCILSHLNPFTFRSYVFSEKRLNPQYLKNTVPCATNKMKAFIAFRENLDKQTPGEPQNLYHDLSHDLFHYNPKSVDYSARISALSHDSHIDTTWGKTSVLHQILINESNNYFSGQPQYDPYAVAMALRLRVEKLMYNKLDPALRKGFIDEKMTKNKFKYCNNNGILVPDVLYIVSAIHNDADHIKYSVVTNQYIEKPMVYKLQNNAVKEILKKIFGWNGNLLTTIAID